ncbi:hypothetical protein RCL1_007192 [Eukaryota sp. TZLM3-RCL]
MESTQPLLHSSRSSPINARPLIHRQIGAVFIKNCLLQLRRPVWAFIFYVLFPVVASIILIKTTKEFDRSHPSGPREIVYDTEVLSLRTSDDILYNAQTLHWSASSGISTATLGQIARHSSSHAGIFKFSPWMCGWELHEEGTPCSRSAPVTTLIEGGKTNLEDFFYNRYIRSDGSRDTTLGLFLERFNLYTDKPEIQVIAYLNASDVDNYSLTPHLIYDHSVVMFSSTFLTEAVRRFLLTSETRLQYLKKFFNPSIASFPYEEPADADLWAVTAMNVVYSLSFFALPLVLLGFIMEKKDKILQLCRVLGLTDGGAVLGSLTTGTFFYCLICFVIIVPGSFAGIRPFQKTSFLVFLILFVVFGCVYTSIALFLSPLLPSTFLGGLVSLVLLVLSSSTSSVPAFNTDYFNYDLAYFPHYPVYHAMVKLASRSCWDCKGTSLFDLHVFMPNIIVSLVHIVVFSSLGYALLVLLSGGSNLFTQFFAKKSTVSHEDVESAPASVSQNSDLGRERVAAIKNHNLCISAVDVTKVYNPTSVDRVDALKSASLAVPEGSCRVLLGANGSGKTTLISILTGQIPPTSTGPILINNNSIFKDAAKARYSMGFVPQFSVFWSELTLIDHLKFFARLKMPWNNVNRVVNQTIEQVELGQSRTKKLATLSGGQKRRSSIAMCLVGKPSLVIADEISTGVSLDIAKSLWDLVRNSTKNGVSYLVSTHLMQEAAYISDSVSIQKLGEILCIGTHENLVSRFGQGFRLFLSCAPSKVDQVVETVNGLNSDISLFSTVEGVLQFHMPKSVSLLDVFATLNSQKEALGIVDYGVHGSTLEDVFISFN